MTDTIAAESAAAVLEATKTEIEALGRAIDTVTRRLAGLRMAAMIEADAPAAAEHQELLSRLCRIERRWMALGVLGHSDLENIARGTRISSGVPWQWDGASIADVAGGREVEPVTEAWRAVDAQLEADPLAPLGPLLAKVDAALDEKVRSSVFEPEPVLPAPAAPPVMPSPLRRVVQALLPEKALPAQPAQLQGRKPSPPQSGEMQLTNYVGPL